MIYSIPLMVESIASQIKTVWDLQVYDSPTQQGITPPCFFVFLMPSDSRDEIDKRTFRNLAWDIVYVQERNAVDAFSRLHEVAERLQELFETLTYTDGTETIIQHTHDINISIEDQELHFKFRTSTRVYIPEDEVIMQTMEGDNVEVEN